jgi:rfaE bifunctional protein nucleotidyltransferase chain/domain
MRSHALNFRELSPKYRDLAELAEIAVRARESGKKVALANGGFDLLHLGHARYLQAARKSCDLLIVALNSDSSVRKLKGEGRPLIPEEGRLLMLSALEAVDYLTLFSESSVENVLLALRPDYHCKGSDYTPETVPERETVRSYGGEILIVGGDKIYSTSELVKRIRSCYS